MTALSTRLAKLEERVSDARKKRGKLKLVYDKWDVRLHTIAVAAIVLHGQPKIDEPFESAWKRTLEYHGIQVKNPLSLDDQSATALQIWPKIKKADEDESTWFTEVFSKAPSWFRQFTRIGLDAYCLKFDLTPTAHTPVAWGSDGFAQARGRARLPVGIMSAGDPIPKHDARQMEIALVAAAALPFSQFEYDPWADPEPPDPPLMELFDELDNKPVQQWTRYEKRRMREFE
jgi:hypothetical protein